MARPIFTSHFVDTEASSPKYDGLAKHQVDMVDAVPLPYPSLRECAQSARTKPKIVRGVPLSSWRQDDKSSRCGICSKKFGLLRRKHHCRACGDICCRRCLAFCLVDVPEQGVDLVYTCARCVQKNSSKKAVVGEVTWPYAEDSQGGKLRPSRSTGSIATTATSESTPSPSPGSPCSFAWSTNSSGSSSTGVSEFNVVVSQHRNQKLHSVCSLVVDYLDCAGGAIVLVKDHHLWILAHKGINSRVLHDPTFLSTCSQALSSQNAIVIPVRTTPSSVDSSTFQFFGASPLFDVRESAGPALGCIVALDTRPRNAVSAAKMKTSLDSLADHVMDLLAAEKTVMRIYASGDFKIFASTAVSSTQSTTATPLAGLSRESTAASSVWPRRSSSFASAEEFVNRNSSVPARKHVLNVQHHKNLLRGSGSVSSLKAA